MIPFVTYGQLVIPSLPSFMTHKQTVVSGTTTKGYEFRLGYNHLAPELQCLLKDKEDLS